MSLVFDLTVLQRIFGSRIVLSMPPACAELIARARSEGIRVGKVFILSRPLCAGLQASCDRQTGDMWCWYDATSEQGTRETLQHLLFLIALMSLHFSLPFTIEDDWAQMDAMYDRAFWLAQQWGYQDLFSNEERDLLVAENEDLCRCHNAICSLIGMRSPHLARTIYQELLPVQQQFSLTTQEFAEALEGKSVYEHANDLVLDVDRSLMRTQWAMNGTQTLEERMKRFEAWKLPQTPASTRILRQALETTLEDSIQAFYKEERQPKVFPSMTFFQIETKEDLPRVLREVNTWMLDLPERFARATWHIYADAQQKGSAHLYQLRVEYVDAQSSSQDTVRREMWILFPIHSPLEAAWQRYLESWLMTNSLDSDGLQEGLQLLWERLASYQFCE